MKQLKKQSTSPKILLWDVETAPMEVMIWSLYKPRPSHDSIIHGTSLLTAAWKWFGEKEVHSDSVLLDSPRDDKALTKTLWNALAEADILVHHNGDKFDMRKLNARVAFHKLPPLPRIPMIDTLKAARKYFAFDSNRLDYLGKHLLGSGKIKTDFSLWTGVLEGDKKSLKRMLKYNKEDVRLLERIYERLRPFIENHPSYAVYRQVEACPNCGSLDFKRNGTRVSHQRRYQRHRCLSCGHQFPGLLLKKGER